MIPPTAARPSSRLLTVSEWYSQYQQGRKAPLPYPVRQLATKWNYRQEFVQAMLLWFCKTRRLEELRFPVWALEKSLKEFLLFLIVQGWNPREVTARQIAEIEMEG